MTNAGQESPARFRDLPCSINLTASIWTKDILPLCCFANGVNSLTSASLSEADSGSAKR